MKKILILALSVIISLFGNSQTTDFKELISSYQKIKGNKLKSSMELKTDSTISQIWNGSAFRNSSKYTFEYLSNGKLSLQTQFNWNNSGGQWVPSFKNEYVYEVNGIPKMDFQYWWNNLQAKWDSASKIFFYQDENGNDTLYISYGLALDEWSPSAESKFNYDSNGNVTYSLSCHWNWDSMQWDSNYITENYYDEIGLDTLSISRSWDSYLNGWVSKKMTTFYDGNGNDTLACNYNRDEDSSEWIPYDKVTKMYDENGFDTLVIGQLWDTSTDQWNNYYKYVVTIEADGHIIIDQNYGWIKYYSTWELGSRTTYYSSENMLTGIPDKQKSTITVYPNPAREFIEFDISPVSGSSVVGIFDLQGRKVLEERLQKNKQIPIGGLSKGMYIYKINNGGIIITGKILIE